MKSNSKISSSTVLECVSDSFYTETVSSCVQPDIIELINLNLSIMWQKREVVKEKDDFIEHFCVMKDHLKGIHGRCDGPCRLILIYRFLSNVYKTWVDFPDKNLEINSRAVQTDNSKRWSQCVIWHIGTYVTYVPGYIGFWSIFIRYIGFWVHRFFFASEAGQFFFRDFSGLGT